MKEASHDISTIHSNIVHVNTEFCVRQLLSGFLSPPPPSPMPPSPSPSSPPPATPTPPPPASRGATAPRWSWRATVYPPPYHIKMCTAYATKSGTRLDDGANRRALHSDFLEVSPTVGTHGHLMLVCVCELSTIVRLHTARVQVSST